ncbi:MAG: hypothetical protein RIC16_04790 [Rhodospirillales bacterium]
MVKQRYSRFRQWAVAFPIVALTACMPATIQYQPAQPTTLATGGTASYRVAAAASWLDTGIQVRTDEVYKVSSSGGWQASPFCDETGAGGLPFEHLLCMKGIFASSFPLPTAPIGALVGKIGADGPPFLIGDQTGFIADRNGSLHLMMNDPEGFLGDNIGALEVQVARHGGGADGEPQTASASATRDASIAADPQPRGSGFYEAEKDIVFNVLETVRFDPATGDLLLAGRFDPALAGPSIPYLQHLAVFIENPRPQISLDWTPEFERDVDRFFREMDDVRNMADLVGSGRLLDDNGRITAKGELFLPMFGVKAFNHGDAPGLLGAETQRKELGVQIITRVTPGGAADRAGLRAGDEIHNTTTPDGVSRQPFSGLTFYRDIRFAGAGAEVMFNINGWDPANQVSVVLDAYPGNAWEHVTKYDVNQQIFRQAGYADIANMLVALDDFIRHEDSEDGLSFMWLFLYMIGTGEWAEQNRQRVMNGEVSQDWFMNELPRQMTAGMESTAGFAHGTLMNPYEDYRARTGDPWAAMDYAILEMNRQFEPMLKEALRSALQRNDEITMPVSTLTGDGSVRPRVVPRYIGIPADSELARLFVEADYAGKAIIHDPALAARIPAYRTEYAFTGDRPGTVRETTNRLWIEPGRMDVHRDADDAVLRFGRTEMTINVGRAIDGGSERRDDAYARFLTGLYDDLAREFPSLHELREAAKLAVVARWIGSRDPSFRLPAEGRAILAPPDSLEGFLSLIWSPKRIKVSLIAPGGIDFNVPPIGPSGPVFPDDTMVNIPVDASVVDLRDVTESAAAPALDPAMFGVRRSALEPEPLPARYRRALTEPPLPASVRLVARATQGRAALDRIAALEARTRTTSSQCDAAASRELRDVLDRAAATARQLHGTDMALNAITAQLPERERVREEVNRILAEEPVRIHNAAVDLFTAGLLNAYDDLEGSVKVRSISDFETLIRNMRVAKDELSEINGTLSNLNLAIETATAGSLEERERATRNLLAFMKDTLGDAATLRGSDAVTRAFRAGGKAVKFADTVESYADQVTGLYKLSSALDTLWQLDAQADEEVQALRDTLLPLRKELLDRLHATMDHPLVQAFESGDPRLRCGAPTGG